MTQLMIFAESIKDKELRTKFMRKVCELHRHDKNATFEWEYLNELLNSLQD